MQTKEVRSRFLAYFQRHNHEVISSSSLVPVNDPTLLFTNAGMNQFKDVFLGFDSRAYNRATTAQKCVRAGGKHNDLENVGYTARHHTFFEMLGNFSFGDYFKTEAIRFAWDFLTQELQIPEAKLYVTVYSSDEETYNIWLNQIKLPKNKIIRIGDKPSGGSDNFWQMGDTGPCGPCTEIFYDHGESVAGGLPGSEDEDGDRYVEVWNCVFMQYNRDKDGNLHPLPKPSVDTGMGLERISAVMQGVSSNYDIDLFKALIQRAATLTQCDDLSSPSLKVLSDHIRSIAFLIADGVIPANDGRGYVLRRIIRRAVRHGYQLGVRGSFLYGLVDELVVQMGEQYPELIINKEKIQNTIKIEEEKFFQTIDNGMGLLHNELSSISGKLLSGEVAFKLYDTYGFPLDLTADISKEAGVSVDIDGFNRAMDIQKNQAKASGKFKMGELYDYNGKNTEFLGYDCASVRAEVLAIFDQHNNSVMRLSQGERGIIVLSHTVFYAQSGGQIGDTGVLQVNGGVNLLFDVNDTQKLKEGVVGHFGAVTVGAIGVGDFVDVAIDMHRRQAIKRNHSATHLLHKALNQVIGAHAIQKGSYVCDEYTRFDFAHDKPLTRAEVEKVEQIVNHVIMMNYQVVHENMNYDDAIKSGVTALFGEKYGEIVRVISMGNFSVELCGGTHVGRTGDIGFFSITSESGVASGIRRIEAITGEVALMRMQKNMFILDGLRETLKAQTNDIITEKVVQLSIDTKDLTKEIQDLKVKLATYQADELLGGVVKLGNGVNSLVVELHNMDGKVALEIMDRLKHKLGSGIIVFGINNGDRVNLMVGVTKDLTTRYKAGEIVSGIAKIVGGKGGGRADLAQAGGNEVSKLRQALDAINQILLQVE